LKILIDTHIFLWLAGDTARIEEYWMNLLTDLNNDIYLSAISIAEMMIKQSIGSLNIDFDIYELCEQMGIEVLSFDGYSALKLGTLPFHHKDPFDRMIISQAITHNYSLMSADRKFSLYDCGLIHKE